MKHKLVSALGLLLLLVSIPLARADEIVLRSGGRYSGKFIRGDGNSVEFRILDRVQTFKTSEIAQISFKEPEIESATTTRRQSSATAETASTGSTESTSSTTREISTPPVRPAAAAPSPSASSVSPQNTLPEGTPVTIRTTTVIDTDRNRVGDTFDATLENPLSVGDQLIFPRGTPVHGRIAIAKESGRISGQSELVLELTEIESNGKRYAIRTSDYHEIGSSRGQRTATTVGGTAALGAIIGAIAGGGKGAAVGAASGAAVGTGVQVLTKGQTLKVPAETVLEFRLQSSLAVD